MKLYKEKINIVLGAGGVWSWRRIVFTIKGPELRDLLPASTYVGGFDTVNHFTPLPGQPAEQAYRLLQSVPDDIRPDVEDFLFKGQRGIDWYDPMTAPTERRKITVLADATKSFSPRNESGMVINTTRRYFFNKNIMYDDEEVGNRTVGLGYSTTGKPGMGDVYIWDYVRLETPASSGTASFKMGIEGSLYWHEK